MLTRMKLNKILAGAKTLILMLILTLGLVPSILLAQNMSINKTGAAPASSAMLHVSSTDQGLLIPRMTEDQKLDIIPAAEGLLIYQTDGNKGIWMMDSLAGSWNWIMDSATIAGLIQDLGRDTLGNHEMSQNLKTNGHYISNDGDNEGLLISSDGGAAINTTAPTGDLRFHVYRASGNSEMRLESGGDNDVMYHIINQNEHWTLGNTGFSKQFRISDAGRSAERMTIDTNGHMGIGTSSPDVQLHVDGGSDVSLTDGGYFVVGDISGTNLAFDHNEIEARNNGSESALRLNGDGGEIRMHYQQGGTTRVLIQDDGDMAIGHINPSDRIHVYGTNPRYRAESSTNGFAGLVAENTAGEYFMGVQGTFDSNPGEFHIYQNSGGGGQRMVIDSDGQVGFSQANPTVRLQVDGGSDASLTGGTGYFMLNAENTTNIVMDDNEIMARNNGAESTLHLQTDGGDLAVHNSQGGTTRFIIEDNGSVGIGTNAPDSWLHLNHPTGVGNGFTIENATGGGDSWELYHFSTDNLTLYFNGTLRGTFSATNGAYTSSSDRRLKNSIEDYPTVLDDVLNLRLKSYLFNWQDPAEDKQVGFIAQDVLEVFPHLVSQSSGDEGESTYTLDYAGFSPLAIKAIQEQQAMIKAMEARLEQLEQEIEELKK
mgnify:CR=1 FL=1